MSCKRKGKRKAMYGAIISALSGLTSGISNTVTGAIDASIEYDEYGVPIDKDSYVTKQQQKSVAGLIDPVGSLGKSIGSFATGNWKQGLTEIPGIGAVGNLAFGKSLAKDKLKDLEEQANEVKALEREAKVKRDTVSLANFKTNEGYTYALGGKSNKLKNGITVDNGDLIPIANDMVVAKGATHENNGITLKRNGEELIEIEDEEVIKGNKIYSDRILLSDNSSIADEAASLGAQKGRYEKLSKTAPESLKRTYNKLIASIDTKLNSLFAQQDSIKEKAGLTNNNGEAMYGNDKKDFFNPNKEDVNLSKDDLNRLINQYRDSSLNTTKLTPITGKVDNEEDLDFSRDKLVEIEGMLSKRPTSVNTNTIVSSNETKSGSAIPYGDIINVASSVMDNVYSSIKNEQLKKKKIPTPELEEPIPLKTTYNINASLNEIDKSRQSTLQLLKDNSISSNQLTAKAMSMKTNSDLAKASLFQNKENIETQLQNQNIILANTTDARNKMKLDKYKQSKYNKEVLTDIVNPIENVKDLSNDIRGLQEYYDMQKYQDRQIAESLNRTTGTTASIDALDRMSVSEITANPQTLEAAKRSIKGFKGEELIRALKKLNDVLTSKGLTPLTLNDLQN